MVVSLPCRTATQRAGQVTTATFHPNLRFSVLACHPTGRMLRESCFEAECLLFHGAVLSRCVSTVAVLLDLAPSLAAAAGSWPGAVGQQSRYQVTVDSCESVERLLGLPPGHGSIRAATGETALHWATAAGSSTVVQRYLAAAPQLAAVPSKYSRRLPLHLAATAGDVPLLRLLLEAAPQAAAAADIAGQTPLAILLEQRHVEAADLLLAAHPASVAASSIDGLPLLHWCVAHGKAGTAARLLAAAPQAARLRASDSSTALHQAAACCNVAMLQMLVAACPSAAAVAQDDGLLPIHSAAQRPALASAVGSLLAAAPGTAFKAYRGSLPLHFAAAKPGMANVVGQLLKVAPAAAAVPDGNGNVALHLAVGCGDAAIVEKLLAAAPAAVNALSSLQSTPFTQCMHSRRTDLLELLLRARPDAQYIRTALWMAISSNFVEGLECLVAAVPSAASIPWYEHSDQNFLHCAARFGHGAALQILVQADPAATLNRDATGRTPIWSARTPATLRALMPSTPTNLVLQRLNTLLFNREEFPSKYVLISECVASIIPLSAADWALVPPSCPALGHALPRALAHSDGQARSLVAHLPAADCSHLQLFALCLHRAQHRLHIHLPPELVRLLLSLFDA